MEFTKIISSPVFACSAPDIGLKAQSAGDVTLKVSTPEFSWEIVLSTLKNSAGENLVTIRLRDILSSVTAAPSPSETDADAALPLLFVNLAASNSEGEQASTDIPVAYGNLSGKSPADFIGQWLTSREQVCRTYTWARERLSLIFGPQLLRWSGQVTLKIKCKAYFLSGSPETFELASVSSSENTYYTADCSYARIAALAESESPLVAWDLSYTLTGTDADGESASLESYPQRFLLGRQDERIREFIFVNCFGMEDRVFGEGISKRKVDGSSTTFIAGGQKMEVYNDSETVFEAFSGQLADRRSIFHWHDFLSSATRLLLRPTDASLTRIVIDSHDSETEDFSVGGINFSYRLSDRHSDYPGGLYGSIGDYDPTQQFGALWVDKDPAAVTPEEGDLFFLKHRLSEFPSFNVADELLFLVQSPLTDAWGAFSVGNLKLWIGKFIDNGAKSIRLNALADYETSEGGVIDPAALQNGSIPVWDAAAGAYRPVPASKLGDFIAGKPLYPLIFEKAGKEVDRYTPDVQKTVLDISDVASAKVLSDHISDAAIHVTASEREAWNLVASLFGVDENGDVKVKGGRGLWSESFMSSRGSDPEAGSSGSGLDEDAMWDALAAGTSEQINVTHIPALNISKITGLQSALDGKLNNGSTTYDTAYARNLTINGITYGIWATANPAALGPFYIPTSAGASGYILQSTGGVPAWLSRAALTQQLFTVNAGCVHIPENSDLNDYTTPGLYSCWANATVATIANVPNTAAFSLVVLQTAGVIQIFREYGYGSNANEYTRRYYNGTWTSWVRAPRLNELYTKKEADGRYLKLSGGTLTGDLTTRNVLLPANYNIVYSVTETGAAMVGFRNGRTVLGTIGASTTAATHLRSITGHATIGSSDAATYNILDTGNYTTYTVTKTGGGASGTWGISISGNAASATTATNATNLAEVAGTKYLYHLRTNGYNIDTGSTVNPRVYEINNPDGTPPTTNPWIQVLMWGSGDSGYGTQLANQYNVEGNLYFRNKISGTWKPWRTLLDSSNYTSYAVSLTGAQTVSGAKTFLSPVTAPALTYNRKYQTRCDSVGWYRCFTFTHNNAVCPTAILHVSRLYNTADGESYVFAISLGYDGKVSVTQLSGIAAKRFITKIRVAYVNLSTAYVDFYYSPSWSGSNEVYVSSSGIGISQAPTPVNDTTSSFYEFETADGCKSDTYVTAGQYVYSPKGLFGLTEAQANSYAGSGYYKLAVGQQSPSKGASLLLYRDSTSYQSYIVWSTGSADHAVIGIKNGTNDLDITNQKGAIKLTGQGTLTYNNYTVWHAGNDGSGSGLDADLLDGTQKSGLLTSAASTAATNLSVTVGGTTKSVAGLYATYLDGYPATSFDLSTNLGTCQDYGCYVIGLMQITDYTTAGNHANGELILIRQNGNNPPQKIIYSLSTMYNTENVRFGHLVVGYYSNRATPCTFTHNGKKWAGFNVTVASAYSNGVVCKRDGLRLGERSTPFLLMYKNSSTGEVLDSEVNGSLSVDGGDITNDGVSTTRFVGALEGNAASATKLATARSLWGQSFNGTGNVSGDMTGVGLINGALHIEEGDDIVRLGTSNHVTEFYGYGYLYKRYYFRPGYASAGATTAAVYIQNASASDNPTFTTTHAFEASGNATHTGLLTTKGLKTTTINATSDVTVGAAGNVSLSATSGVGLMIDSSRRNLSWTVDTSGGWARSLRATDAAGETTLINAVGIYGSAQTPRYVYLGGTDADSPSMAITAGGNVGIGTTSPGCRLDVRGAGYFSGVLGANGMTLPYGGSSWISMASTPAVLKGAMNQSTISAHPLFRVKNSAGDAIVFGGLGSNTGFYGFTAERISSGSNSYDWYTTWNVGTGRLTHNGAMTVGGLLTASGGLTTPQYVQVGSGRLKWDAEANALYVEKSDGTACGFYVKGFLSARGSDPESAAGSGLDEDAMWELLAASGTEKIDESHLPTATASTPGIVKGGYAYKVPGSQTSVNLPVTITASGQMYVSVPASAIKTILMNLG